MSLHFRSLFLSVIAVTTIWSTDGYIQCPKCTYAMNMSQCFLDTQICSSNQMCYGTMAGLKISVQCGLKQNCELTVLRESERCTSGDAFGINDECHFCCSDLEDCRRQMEFVQKGVNSADEVLHCPTCSVATKDPMDCFRNLQPCDPNVKVCSVEWTGNEVIGGCEKNLVLCRLHESQSWGHCGRDSSQHNSYCARCCSNSQCLMDAFYINTTTAADASTTSGLTTTTTDAVTTTQVVSCSGMLNWWPTSTTTGSTEFETTTETSTITTTPTTTTTTAETTTTSTIITTETTTTPITTTETTITTTETTITTTETTTTPTTITTTETTITTTETTTTPTTTMTTPIITTPTPTQTTTTLATTTTPATKQSMCTDSSSVDCTVPGLCDINFGKVYCPRTCNNCESAEMTTPSPICEDNLIDMVFKCTNLPDICSQANAQALCPRTCGYCN